MTPLSEELRLALSLIKQRAEKRRHAFAECEEQYEQRKESIEASFREAVARIAQTLAQQQSIVHNSLEESRRIIQDEYTENYDAGEAEYNEVKAQAKREQKAGRDQAEADFKESRWTIMTLYEADKKVARDQLTEATRRLKKNRASLKSEVDEARELIRSWPFARHIDVELDKRPDLSSEEPWDGLRQRAQRATKSLNDLKTSALPQLLKGKLVHLVVLLLWLFLCAPALFLDPWYFWPLLSTCVVLPIGWLTHFIMLRRARNHVARCWQTVAQSALDCKPLRKLCIAQARRFYKQERRLSKDKHQKSIQRAANRFRQQLQQLTKIRRKKFREADAAYPPYLEELGVKRDNDIHAAESRAEEHFNRAQQHHDEELQGLEARHEQRLEDLEAKHTAAWNAIVESWGQACAEFEDVSQRIDGQCNRWFPPWEQVAQHWREPEEVPLGLPLGTLDITTDRLPHSVPEDDRLPGLELDDITFRGLLPFPDRSSLLLSAMDLPSREQGIKALENLLLRCWTSLPPGKMRCTIIDPVGRGENFSAFMHLADQDESLINSRIWTEANHIEHRLTDLTAQMETVLQKFLRNQYQTLAQYNAQAGEVAEPFRFLVVAHFPVNFSTEAARRLISLASAGARCGIYTLVLYDAKQPMPQGVELADLEDACITLHWREGRYLWRDPDFVDFPLTLERPPSAEVCTQVLGIVGERAKLANRVEVPFSSIAPAADEIWTGDSGPALAIPLGRAGATGKQFLTLGRGTSQHVLIAGKTGSGKSTLLHVLITQIALRFAPDQVELYLIDFKKGVEFKTYASHQLPHARVIAVESEREFGLSVLQRLDAELVKRGEIFRAHGVNDLPDYRQLARSQTEGNGQSASNGPTLQTLPRVLLVVDEFQEFFVEDDKLAQEAALLLDRLVRQGRAFGIHIILGSQTLGGAYSLARSTIDQMAVRIALQCSETDAHLILSKDNSEARLLSRPGEAIYNSANGLLEGNNLFQTVWLADQHRDALLQQVAGLAAEKDYQPPHPTLVFEGTAPSDLAQNALLARSAQGITPAVAGWHAWLGDAVAIKDPTAAVFRNQSGSNLLLLGQDNELAFRLMIASVVSLAVQRRGQDQDLPLIIGSALEKDGEDFLARLPEAMPIRILGPRELPDLIALYSEELERRQKGDSGPPLFLPLYGLQRLRDLRKPEDDFGFMRGKEDEPPSPARQFQNLLREGPPLGIFTLLWCDTATNLQRFVDRQGLRELELRVLMQMSANDSSNMMDSPVASRLGPYRALYYTEDQGKIEKFRPYALPDLTWLKTLFPQHTYQPDA